MFERANLNTCWLLCSYYISYNTLWITHIFQLSITTHCNHVRITQKIPTTQPITITCINHDVYQYSYAYLLMHYDNNLTNLERFDHSCENKVYSTEKGFLMYLFDRNAVQARLRKNILTRYEKILYGAVTTLFVFFVTATPLYIIYQLFGIIWSLLGCAVLICFVGLNYLTFWQKKRSNFFTQCITLGFPLSIRITLYCGAIYIGLAIVLLLILGPKFIELLYIEQLVNLPNVPIMEPLLLFIGNKLQQNTKTITQNAMKDDLSKKTINSIVTHTRNGLFFILLALSVLPAVWFYVWLHKEMSHFNKTK